MGHVPATLVRTGHALTIKALGKTVGLINGWTPAQGRGMTPIFEVGEDDSGNPQEYMPGNMTGMTLTVNRFDTYTRRMEQAFGTPDMTMLTRQAEPFSVIEVWTFPKVNDVVDEQLELGGNSQLSATDRRSLKFINKLEQDEERFIYTGCWFTSLGRTIRSDDNRIVNVNASLVYTKKLKGTGIAGGLLSFEGLPI